MEELVIEGLTPSDFITLEKILKTYKVSLSDDIKMDDIKVLYIKVSEIVNYLNE
jgi:hypothetical protein